MNKKIISMILAICLCVGLIGSVSAFAADNNGLISYTMQQGDTVANVCARLGIDFHANQKIIAKLNNINDYTKIPVGKVLQLPTKDYVASTTNVGTTAGTTTIATGSSVTGVGGLQAGDYVAYYLIPYTMQAGDYVLDVCNRLGINFSANSEIIKSFNGITYWNNIKVGKTIYLPSATLPAGTSNATAIVAHRIQSGESALSIATSYGMNYSNISKTMQALNPNVNLNKIYAGNLLFLPVNTSNLTAAASATATATTTAAKSSGVAHKLINSNSGNGSFQFYVNGSVATTAVSGTTVEIRCVSAGGYQPGEMEAMGADGMSVKVSDSKFTMPDCDVTVSVNFVSEKYYSVVRHFVKGGAAFADRNNNPIGVGTIDFYVNGKDFLEGYANIPGGSKIYVKTNPNSGYEVSAIWYTDDAANSWKQVSVTNGFFYMPDCDVWVTADFVKAESRDIIVEKAVDNDDVDVTSLSDSDFTTKVGNKNTKLAYTGENVQVVLSAAKAKQYKIIDVQVWDNTTGKYLSNAGSDTFVMPANAVKLRIVVSQNPVDLSVSSLTNGTAWYEYNNRTVTSVTKDKMVTAIVKPNTGFAPTSISLDVGSTTYDLSYFTAQSDGTWTYTFKADDDATLTAKFGKKTQTVHLKSDSSLALGSAYFIDDTGNKINFTNSWQTTTAVTPGQLYYIYFTANYGKVARIKWVGNDDGTDPSAINAKASWIYNYIETQNSRATLNMSGSKDVYIVAEFFGAEYDMLKNTVNCTVTFYDAPYGSSNRHEITKARQGQRVYADVVCSDYYTVKNVMPLYTNDAGLQVACETAFVQQQPNLYTTSFIMSDRVTTFTAYANQFRYGIINESGTQCEITIDKINVTDCAIGDKIFVRYRNSGLNANHNYSIEAWYEPAADGVSAKTNIPVNADGTFTVPQIINPDATIHVRVNDNGTKSYTLYSYVNGKMASASDVDKYEVFSAGKLLTQTVAKGGETISFVCHPGANRVVTGVSVTNQQGGVLTFTTVKPGEEYSFKMPEMEATINVTFGPATNRVYLDSNGAGKSVAVEGDIAKYGWTSTVGANIYGGVVVGNTVEVKTNIPVNTADNNDYLEKYVAVGIINETVNADTIGYSTAKYTYNNVQYWSFKFKMPANPVKIKLEAPGTPFPNPNNANVYTLAVYSGITGGTVSVSPNQGKTGETVNISVAPDTSAGYYSATKIEVSDNYASGTYPGVQKDGVTPATWTDVSGTMKYTFASSDATVYAEFSNAYYNVTNGTTDPNVTVSNISKSTAVKVGETVTFDAVAAAGYTLNPPTVTGATVTPGTPPQYSFVMPAANVTITATATAQNFDVTNTTAPVNGSITTPSFPYSAACGSTVTIDLKPDAGYVVDTITFTPAVAETKVSDTQYTFTMPASNVDVKVTFKPADLLVTVNATGGAVKLDHTNSLYNITQTVSAALTPDKGMEIDTSKIKLVEDNNGTKNDVTSDPTYALTPSANPVTFTMGGYPVELTVDFVKSVYDVSEGTADTNGTVTVNPPGKYSFGDKVTFICKPGSGYSLKTVDIIRDSDSKVVATYDAVNGTYTPTLEPDITEFDDTHFTMPAYKVTVQPHF